MVTAVLHLHEDARQAASKARDEMRRHLPDSHDVADRDLLAASNVERGARLPPGLPAHLLVIADDAIDFRHFGKHVRLGLRRAAGDDDA